jgi:Putative auto-transporter adhesin, head GIN domain
MTIAPTPLRHPHTSHRYPLAIAATLVLLGLGVFLLLQSGGSDGSSSSSAVQGSGVPATQARALMEFSSVDLAGSNNVVVRVGGEQSVVVHADDNLLDNVTTRVQAGSLVIGNTGNFTTESPMSVEIVVPSLRALTLSGSGLVSLENVHAQELTVALSGSGVLSAGGTVTRLVASLGGSGDARLEHLVARDVRAVVGGSGRMLVNATETLDASVPGAGAIVYIGNPEHVTSSVTGFGAVTQG